MYQLNRSGKDLVIYGLVVNLIGGIFAIIGYGGDRQLHLQPDHRGGRLLPRRHQPLAGRCTAGRDGPPAATAILPVVGSPPPPPPSA